MGYSLYLFDADGTLFDYGRAEHVALKGACTASGVPYGPRTEKLYAQINGRFWTLYEQGHVDIKGLQIGRFEELLGALGSASCDPAQLNETYLGLLSEGAYLLPDALEICQALRARGRRLALVTNGMLRTQKGRFEASALRPLFDRMIVSEDIGCAKPDPRYFDHALRLLSHENRRDVLVVGDSLTADIAGGIAAGLDTCWVCRTQSTLPPKPAPRFIVRSLPEILRIDSGEAGPAAVSRAHEPAGMSDAGCPLVFRWSKGLAGFDGARLIREEVFIREQGFAHEFDETDRTSEHLTAWLGGRPVAAARLFSEGGSVWHVGRVCVAKDCRGRRWGTAVMQEVLRRARALGALKVVLGAQLHAVPFYEKVGFSVTGGLFEDEGVPHLKMEIQFTGPQAPANG